METITPVATSDASPGRTRPGRGYRKPYSKGASEKKPLRRKNPAGASGRFFERGDYIRFVTEYI
jgi:hypothetical protein